MRWRRAWTELIHLVRGRVGSYTWSTKMAEKLKERRDTLALPEEKKITVSAHFLFLELNRM